MIYLISMFKDSYAKREMEYTRQFLNFKCKDEVAKCVSTFSSFIQMVAEHKPEDFFVVADYKCHPYYWSQVDIDPEAFSGWDEGFKRLNTNKIVVWYGDSRFKVDFIGVNKAISCVPQIFEPLTEYEQRVFFARNWYSGPAKLVTWKYLLPQLEYHYTLSETMVDWFTYVQPIDGELADLVYIINSGAAKYRKRQVKMLDKLNYKMILGNWSESSVLECSEFYENHPCHIYMNRKFFGPGEWLSVVQRGKFTIIQRDDDLLFRKHFAPRFWEAARVDTIPLIHIENDPDRVIYKDCEYLRDNAYYYDAEDLNRIIENFEMRIGLPELQDLVSHYIGV